MTPDPHAPRGVEPIELLSPANLDVLPGGTLTWGVLSTVLVPLLARIPTLFAVRTRARRRRLRVAGNAS
ncbi:MAG TPA: hypothetical protein VFD84_06020 [Candidatus Binatia bacterium]|jgi:hypothetical protein|nr:hypothetical protein [Candidatus Binatia bacterium]